jgi:DNA-binding XRE family transcriptional regulator
VKKSHYENLVAIVVEMEADKQRGRDAYNLITTRKTLGLSQSQLGEAIGLTGRMIRYYESGERPIPKTVQMALHAYARMRKETDAT